jgi:hypothetical protein
MNTLNEPISTSGRARRTATRFQVAIVASIVLHALTLWELPAMPRLRPGPLEAEPVTLNVRLAPAPSPPAPADAPRERARAAPERPATPRPARERPAPPPASAPAVPASPAPAAAPASRPAEPDLMAYVEARRRARGAGAEPASPSRAELSDDQRASRIAANNLASAGNPIFGYDPDKSGGVFTIEHLGPDYAEFTFTGWNGDAKRYTKQLIEVRRGAHSDIRFAVVREMLTVIRRYEPEEFEWDSRRLGRSITLSSRPRDSAGVEDFLMQEFFPTSAAARR